ncbi:DNA recombination protein RmuC [Actinomadura rayongensis]|uniref:DNA recombination protein RmuC n=1 Tax=Actinomadura rayongensis TaxID=1429076 RepID=A0A6I4WFH0_9ACTN|nr:DNA recombination protein RmuC [Actinomadura rayongensis]MXQ65694.1 DNA recombination protein RmuC [Actinomadura rayongensis]
MNLLVCVVLCSLSGALFGALGYVLARSRYAAERSRLSADLQVVRVERDQARTQADELRSERDRARSRAEKADAAWADLSARYNERAEQAARLGRDLETTREKLQAAEKENALLKESVQESVQQTRSLEERLQQSRRAEAKLQGDVDRQEQILAGIKQDLAVARKECEGLRGQQAEVEAARKALDTLRDDTARQQTKQFEAFVTKMLESSQDRLIAVADDRLGSVDRAITERLADMAQRLSTFDSKRSDNESRLSEQLRVLADASVQSSTQARALADALRKPQVRGNWGELHLRRAVELANMKEHCDFELQKHIDGDERSLRPDMVVHLAGGKRVVVDGKVSLAAFLDALEATDDADRERHMARHARHVRKHIDTLAAKEYYRNVAGSPEFVVMYLPSEALLQAALDTDPRLVEHAAKKRIVIATPTVLIAMLRTVAIAWTQAALQENLRQVHDLGRELHKRLATMATYFKRLGSSLDGSMKAYNEAVASLEGRVMVTARKFKELKVVDEDLHQMAEVNGSARPLKAPELLEAASAEPVVRAVESAEHESDVKSESA